MELEYEGWVLGGAKVDNSIYLKSESVMKTNVDILKNGTIVGKIISEMGHMEITIDLSTKQQLIYKLQYSTPKKLKLDVFNKEEVLQFSICEMTKKNDLSSKFNRNYCINMKKFDFKMDIYELLMYCGFAARTYLLITDCNYYFAESLKP